MFERRKQAGKIYSLPIDQIRPVAVPGPERVRRAGAGRAWPVSIRENGLLQPISVRKHAGRRLRAGGRGAAAARCKWSQTTTIPAILWSYADEQTVPLACWKIFSAPT